MKRNFVSRISVRIPKGIQVPSDFDAEVNLGFRNFMNCIGTRLKGRVFFCWFLYEF